MHARPDCLNDTVSIASDPEHGLKRPRLSIAAADATVAIDGELLDESCAGIGLAVDAEWAIDDGATVTINYFGIPVRGAVRYRIPLEDGRQRLGVQWTA